MFLKEKQDQSVKARMCTDGQKQRGDWGIQDTTLSSISTEAVFITTVIKVHKECDIAFFDIPGTFLHANSNKDITMILNGRLALLIVQVVPNLYRKYISVDNKMGHTSSTSLPISKGNCGSLNKPSRESFLHCER
jgi:hypothetical protein